MQRQLTLSHNLEDAQAPFGTGINRWYPILQAVRRDVDLLQNHLGNLWNKRVSSKPYIKRSNKRVGNVDAENDVSCSAFYGAGRMVMTNSFEKSRREVPSLRDVSSYGGMSYPKSHAFGFQ